MKEAPRISVVVPVYNVESYINKCIESILAQTFNDFELLLIDDGSTDKSSTICKAAQARDKRIRYYRKENGGLSDARNFGIERIKANYVTFIDSDDWVEPTYLEYLYNAAQVYGADIATCVFMLRRGESATPWKAFQERTVPLSSRDALLSLLCADTINVSANSKLYNSSLFADIRFPVGKHFEDVGTTYKLIQNASTVAVGGAPLYNYVMRPGSITNSANSSIFDRAELAEQAYRDLYGKDCEINSAVEQYYVYHLLSVLHGCNLADSEQLAKAKVIEKTVLEHRASVLNQSNTSNRDRVALYALSLGLYFYQFAWNVYCIATGRNR